MKPSSRLALFCNGVIETGWPAVVVVSLLFFNIHSMRVFEPDKAVLVLALVFILCGAWIVRRVEQGTDSSPFPRNIADNAPTIIAAVLAAVVLISTAFSLTPGISLRGNPWRLHGAVAILAGLALFIMAARETDESEVDRLFYVIVLAGLPVALFALIQTLRLDPIAWAAAVHRRPVSTLGNPIFLGACLIMTIFPTMACIGRRLVRLRTERNAGAATLLPLAVLFVILGLQVAALVVCGSRGPWFGAVVGFFWLGLILLLFLCGSAGEPFRLSLREFAAALLAGFTGIFIVLLLPLLAPFRRTWRWLWVAWCVAGIVTGLFVLELNRPASSLAPLREHFYMERLGGIYDGARSGAGSINVRTYIWEGAVGILAANPEVVFPDGRPDRFRLLRPLAGYGPDTQSAVYGQFYPADLARIETKSHLRFVDRSHQDVYDLLLTTGALGFVARQALLILVFIMAFGRMGLMNDKQGRILFVGMWTGLGGAGAIVVALFAGPGLIGVGYTLGAATCAFLYPVYVFFRRSPGNCSSSIDFDRLWTTGGLTAAILAHFVEIQTGMTIVATHVLFFVYAGFLAGPRFRKQNSETGPGQAPLTLTPARAGAMTALVLGTLWFSFIKPIPLTGSIGDIMSTIPAALFGRGASGTAVAIMLAAVAAAGFILATPFPKPAPLVPRRLVVFGSVVLLAPVMAAALGLHRALGARFRTAAPDQLADAAVAASRDLFLFMVFIVLVLIAGAVLATRKRTTPDMPWLRDRSVFWLVPAVVMIVTYGIMPLLNEIRADMVRKKAEIHQAAQRWDRAIAHCRRAVLLAPRHDLAHLCLGTAFFQQALRSPAVEGRGIDAAATFDHIARMNADDIRRLSRTGLMTAARITLEEGRRLSPFNLDHTKALARMHREWTKISPDGPDKASLARQTDAYFRQALTLNPVDFFFMNEWAEALIAINRDTGRARRIVMDSLGIRPGHAPTHMLLAAIERLEGSPENALAACEQALIAAATHRPTELKYARRASSEMMRIYRELGRLEDGVAHARRIAADYPEAWWAWRELAGLLEADGRLEEALNAARLAETLASGADRRRMEALAARLASRAGEGAD